MGFYTQLFGWEAEDTMPDGVEGTHYMCSLRGRDVRRGRLPTRARRSPRGHRSGPPTSGSTTSTRPSPRRRDAGGSVLIEPFDALDGGRIAVIADPAGAAIGIWQPGAHKGAQLVNEPSAYAMSGLVTTDPEGAKRFYPEVFGWEIETLRHGRAPR